MSNGHKRKKAPDLVRQNLLEASLDLMASVGIEKMSLNEVSLKAGVTKGGLLHHFSSKKELIVAAIKYALSLIDRHIYMHLENDQNSYGKFTRAYIKVSLEPDVKEIWDAFSFSLMSDKALYSIWDEWLDGHLNAFKATDYGIDLQMIRYAADGIWLKNFVHNTTADQLLITELISKTYKTDEV